MKRPSLTTYAIGNPVSALCILGGGSLFTYQWLIGQQPDWVPLTAVVAIGSSFGANQRLTVYGNWKRAWDRMNGQDVAAPGRTGAWKILLGLVLWILVASYTAALDLRQPQNGLFLLGFVAFNLLLLGRAVFRRRKSASAARSHKPFIVQILPAVPRTSPGVADIYRGLPHYCADRPLPR